MDDTDPRIKKIRAFAKAKGLRRVLQLGSGEKEGSMAFAGGDFTLTVVDPDRTALDRLKERLDHEGCLAKLVQAGYSELPFSQGEFEFVIAFNSIYLTTAEGVKNSFAELLSKLREDGFFYITLISTRHVDYGRGEEIEPGTFRRDGLVYHYTNAAEAVNLLRHTEVIDIRDEEQIQPGSYHWHVLARKRDLAPSRKMEN